MLLLEIIGVEETGFNKFFDRIEFSHLLENRKFSNVRFCEDCVDSFFQELYIVFVPFCKGDEFRHVKRHIIVFKALFYHEYPGKRVSYRTPSDGNFVDAIEQTLSKKLFLNKVQRLFEDAQKNVHGLLCKGKVTSSLCCSSMILMRVSELQYLVYFCIIDYYIFTNGEKGAFF